MAAAGIPQQAIDVFTHYYRQLEEGVSGFIPEDTIEPLLDPSMLSDAAVSEEEAATALEQTVIIKLNNWRILVRRWAWTRPSSATGTQRQAFSTSLLIKYDMRGAAWDPVAAALHEQLPHSRRHPRRLGAVRRSRRR